MAHGTLEQLEKKRDEALKFVEVGKLYYHYRDPNKLYKVLGLAIQEATEEVCVIYESQYGKNLTWIRNLNSWLDLAEKDGKQVARFQKSAVQ